MSNFVDRFLRFSMVACLLAGLTVTVGPTPRAYAAAINVTTTDPNVNLGDGQCSLIEAINEANTTGGSGGDCPAGNAGADTIELASAATYTLTQVNNNTEGDNGLPSITSSITINGNDSIIERDLGALDFRILYVASVGTFTLNNVTVRNGSAILSNLPCGSCGGGVFNNGTAHINHSTFSSNSARDFGGGAFANVGSTTSISNSIFSSNSNGNSSTGGQGGGLYNFGVLTISNSLFSGNSTQYTGGGIGNGNNAQLTISNSTFSNNSAYHLHSSIGEGGALYNSLGSVIVSGSTFTNNLARDHGGGIHTYGGNLTVSNSTFLNNQNSGISYSGTTVLVANSTFSGNSSYVGGGISGNGALTVETSTFSVNSASHKGGALYLARGPINISNSTFSENSADFDGGAIHYESMGSKNNVTITNSVFSRNRAMFGGSIFSCGNYSVPGPALTITDNSFSDNTASVGGVLYNQDLTTVVINNSSFTNNSASYGGGFSGRGGAIYNDDNGGAITITESMFENNSSLYGGSVYNASSIEGIAVNRATFYNNSAFDDYTSDGRGGAIANQGKELNVTNSTFTGNSSVMGGAIYNGGSATITNSTFSDNLNLGSYSGGRAIYNASTNSPVTIRNTIVANTTVDSNCAGAITNGGNNLQFPDASCNATIPVADPLLGPLADNGGPTQTHALLPGSPAIDAGNNAICAADPVNNLDQRGVKRPQGLACDIGAFEYQLASPDPKFPSNGNAPPTSRPLFDWNNVGEATSYTLQISTSQNFTTLILNTIVTPSAYVLPIDLPRNTLLFWRVRANRPGEAGPWSRVRHFNSADPPGVPALLTPTHNATVSNQPTLDWSDSTPAAAYYEVQISPDPNFATILGRGQGGRVNVSTYTPEAALGSGPFYWRVRAVSDGAGGGMQFSQWSAVRSFNVTP